MKTMKGLELYEYLSGPDNPDTEYASVVKLLPYATMDIEKAISILEELQSSGRRLIAVYPEFDNVDTSEMEFVGDIPDGSLYIENKSSG